MTETRFAAHIIITADAVALGGPEILIMTRDYGLGALLVERRLLPSSAIGGVALDVVRDLASWRAVGDSTEVATGYVIVDVERI